jgi:hypothetical protein
MMNRFTIAVLSLWLGLAPALAQMAPWQPIALQPAPSGGGYTGPMDIITVRGCWALRACGSAWLGLKVISLCDHLGANCADVTTNATTGVLNSPGTRGSDNCNSLTTCLVATIYDQSGAGNDCAISAAAASFNLTGGPGGTRPALIFAGAQSYTCLPGGVPSTFSEGAVAERTGATGSFGPAVSFGGSDDLGFGNGTNLAYAYAGSILTAAATDNAWHSLQAFFVSGTGNGGVAVDGTTTSGSVGMATPGGNTLIGDGVGGFLTGRWVQSYTVASNISGNITALCHNDFAFWGTATSC